MRPTRSRAEVLRQPGRSISPAKTALLDGEHLRRRINGELAAFLERETVRFANPAALGEIFSSLQKYILGGGNRTRGLFCYWGWIGAGGVEGCDEVLRAAAALELFQAFALVHDDIMDGSDLRRGSPSLHRALSMLHNQQQWKGPQARFGTNLAILLGDLCLCYSDELLHQCGLPPDRIRAAQSVVHEMRTEVMIGQNLDLLGQAAGTSVEGALRIIQLKSAKYSIERPLHIGATLAGADQSLLSAYSRFAIPLGEAFQLRDDILGALGDSHVTGKPDIDDLREGKPTMLIAIARERATAAQRSRIEAMYGNSLLDSAGATELRSVLIATGAVAEVTARIEERSILASAALVKTPVSDSVRGALTQLASEVLR